MELRKHQQKSIDLIKESYRKGNKKIVLAAPCSFGKTIVAAHILKETFLKNNRGLFVCDRIKLIDQTVQVFKKYNVDFGVLQGNHIYENYEKNIQIASMQTLSKRKDFGLDFDCIIIDECHTQYGFMLKMLSEYKHNLVIGLSATPYTKNMGLVYDDLIVPITTQELLDLKYLAPIKYFVGKTIDFDLLNKFKSLPYGGNDFDPKQLEKVTDNDKLLTGDIVQNWLLHGENAQTIAFSPSIKQSKFLVEQFNKNGIPAVHIDCYDDPSKRRKLFKDHNEGKFKILSNAKLLNTGYDEPSVSCLIDCYPTKSLTTYVQRIGRIMRISEGKDYAIVLDHANNVKRHGFCESIVPDTLDVGNYNFQERSQIKKTKKQKINDCPECSQIIEGFECKNCGFKYPLTKKLEYTNEILKQVTNNNIKSKTYTIDDKKNWYSDLISIQKERNYKKGWAWYMYKAKFKEEPKGIIPYFSPKVSDEVQNFVKSQFIKYSYKKKREQ